MGGIHFLPAFKFGRDLELVRIRKSILVICHFHPPCLAGFIDIAKSLFELIHREFHVPARSVDGAPENENPNQIVRQQNLRYLE
jgi:hypothetical protein